jgi:predicted proteasome-type protease
MTSEQSQDVFETVKTEPENQDVIQDVIQEIKDIIQEIKDVENVQDVIDVIEHVSQDVEIVVEKVKFENENENSIFNCVFKWFDSFF